MKRSWLIALGLAGIAFLAGCQQQSPPAEAPSPTAVPNTPTATVSADEAPKVVASPTTQVTNEPEPGGPPTAAPPELGTTEALPALASGSQLIITQIGMIDRQQGWALGGSGQAMQRVLRTTDGGANWQEVSPPIRRSIGAGGYQVSAQFINQDEAQILRYIPSPRGGEEESAVFVVWRTTDGGLSWQPSQPLRVPFVAVEGIKPYWDYGQAGAGWILARRGGVGMHQYPIALLKTEDAGASWQLQHGPFETPDHGLTGCTKSGMDFGEAGAGMLTISDCPYEEALLMATTDGGESWQPHLLPAPAGFEQEYQQAAGGGCSAHSPAVLSAQSWRAAVLCRLFDEAERRLSFLYLSENSGATWRATQIPEGELLFLSPEQGWALGRQIFRTDDGGQTWQLVKEVNWDGQFSFVDMQAGWAVAQSDQGDLALVVTADGAASWQIIKPLLR